MLTRSGYRLRKLRNESAPQSASENARAVNSRILFFRTAEVILCQFGTPRAFAVAKAFWRSSAPSA